MKKLAEIDYKDDQTVKFYEDKVEFAENVVEYDNIASITASGTKKSGYILIFFYASFSGKIVFHLKDASKESIKLGGFSMRGIGNTDSSRDRFWDINAYVEKFVAPAMAENIVKTIKWGGTFSIWDLTITKKSIHKAGGFMSSEKEITKVWGAEVNYDMGEPHTIIFDENGKKFATIPYSKPNGMILSHIVNALFCK